MLLFYPCGQSQNCFLLQLAFLYIQQEAQLFARVQKKREKEKIGTFFCPQLVILLSYVRSLSEIFPP